MIAAGTSATPSPSEIDVLPTLVKLAGGVVPADRKIDGPRHLAAAARAKASNRRTRRLFYFNGNRLEAVRSGPWKLAIAPQIEDGIDKHQAVGEGPFVPALYNLDADIGETTDVAAEHPGRGAAAAGLCPRRWTRIWASTGRGPGVRPSGTVQSAAALVVAQCHGVRLSLRGLAGWSPGRTRHNSLCRPRNSHRCTRWRLRNFRPGRRSPRACAGRRHGSTQQRAPAR